MFLNVSQLQKSLHNTVHTHYRTNNNNIDDVIGKKIDEVYIGSCMTNIGHFRAAGERESIYK